MDKRAFLDRSLTSLEKIYDSLESLPNLNLSELDSKTSVLIIVDMVNGFVKSGSLFSERNKNLMKPVSTLSDKCGKLGILKIAFADTHNDDCLEFESYPPHCIKNTDECKVASGIDGYVLIEKNSTNGFLEDKFKAWLDFNTDINTFIIVGNCTDICISQFALTLKAYFNKNNLNSTIIVPTNLVNTFDSDLHDGDLMNLVSLNIMASNGIKLVHDIL